MMDLDVFCWVIGVCNIHGTRAAVHFESGLLFSALIKILNFSSGICKGFLAALILGQWTIATLFEIREASSVAQE